MSSPSPEMAPSLRVVIADDEPLARDCIRLALAAHGGIDVVAECADGEEAAAAIALLGPDLVFLDVQMPGLDGFAVVERIGAERMPPVVFVTAYDEHALRAFALHAIDYVLKPFDDQRFGETVRHARQRVALARESELGRRLAALLREHGGSTVASRGSGASTAYLTRLLVRSGDRIRFVPVDDVDFLEAAGNYVRIHAGARTELIRATVTGLAARLDPAKFVRIHRSTIVSISRIREVQPWFGGDYKAILRDGRELRVSRRHRDELLRPLA